MSYRQVTVMGRVWRYFVGKQHTVLRHPDTNQAIVVHNWEIKGRGYTPDTWERGQWKGTSDGMIKPGRVRGYIEDRIAIKDGRYECSMH
jgi:hypothetical protein